MQKIRKEDEIIVICGKDKTRRGNVTEILGNGKLMVAGINLAKKHQKPNPKANIKGGIVDIEMPINISNVMLLNPETDKGDRVGFKFLKDGKKVRFFKSNGAVIDGDV